MTLKELLNKCEFKDIAPCIINISDTVSLSCFKEAFDILRHLEPAADSIGGGKLEFVKHYNEFTQNTYPLLKQWGELDSWKCELNSEIIVSDELSLTDAEIAALCIWELTYWGDQSSAEGILKILERDKTDSSNPYAVAVENLNYILDKSYVPKHFKNKDSFVEKLVNECLETKPRLSGRLPVCMRDRLEKQKEKLSRMAKVEDAIRHLTTESKSFSTKELDYLFHTRLISEHSYRSCSFDADKRIDYLIDLISNYDTINYSDYTDFILMFRTTSSFPLDQHEFETLQDLFNQRLPATANIRYGFGNDEALETEVSVLLLCSN